MSNASAVPPRSTSRASYPNTSVHCSVGAKGPFRWAALSGDPEDIRVTDDVVLELFPNDDALRRWITLARERVAFQGLPSRA